MSNAAVCDRVFGAGQSFLHLMNSVLRSLIRCFKAQQHQSSSNNDINAII
ncbi:MAG: hypothetical protein HC852_24215 [Acaryochloridaceae cyanobacterium RU_4_10]|nr:hypothetical protein [Acaryochloridaceae cyanobacterium RU_4_10]